MFPGSPRSARSRPTVVFAEDQGLWEVGVDFSSALRQRGLRTVRLLSPGSSDASFTMRRRLTNLLCDVSVMDAYPAGGGLSAAAGEQLSDEDVVDVQCLEQVLDLIHRQTGRRLAPPLSRLPVAQAVDKVAVDAFLASQGIAALSTVADPDELDPRFGGPFMVKQRSGAGGGGATRCEDLGAVREVFAQEPPGTLIVQPYVIGQVLDSAGVARHGALVQAATYRNIVNPRNPFGDARAIVIEDIPDLLELTGRVVAAMGITGPFAIDAVRDSDGRLLVLDVNLRIFGCWAALQDAGLDIVGSYLYSLGLAVDPGPMTLTPGGTFDLIRFDEDLTTWDMSAREWLAHFLAVIYRRRAFLGHRWAAITAARVGVEVARQARRPEVTWW